VSILARYYGNKGKIIRNKIILFSLIATVILLTSCFLFISTKLPAALAFSGLAGVAVCPLMCVAMGGGMWVAGKIGKARSKIAHSDPVD
jgi:hypothetical protein